MKCYKEHPFPFNPEWTWRCELPEGHTGECNINTSDEYFNFLVEQRKALGKYTVIGGERCTSMNPKNPTIQCGLPKGHAGNHSRVPFYFWSEK